MNSEQLSTIYRRFAEKDINVMQARITNTETQPIYILVAEYSLEKQAYATNGIKIIWPKIAIEGYTLGSALLELERTVDEIRSAGARKE